MSFEVRTFTARTLTYNGKFVIEQREVTYDPPRLPGEHRGLTLQEFVGGLRDES